VVHTVSASRRPLEKHRVVVGPEQHTCRAAWLPVMVLLVDEVVTQQISGLRCHQLLLFRSWQP
jgi:hypothetical protein